MSITIKRNTGWMGSAAKIQIRLNGKNIAGVTNNQSVDVEIPDREAHLKVTQFGIKSNQVRVRDGDMIRITSTSWLRISFLLLIIIYFLTIFLSNSTYRLTVYFVVGVLIFITTFLFNGFQLNVSDK